MAAKIETDNANLLDEFYMTTEELAVRWRTSPGTLANNRAMFTGCPYVKLPSGAIRYRVSDVLEAEMAGRIGADAESMTAAIDSFPGIDERTRKALKKHIRLTARG